MIYVIALIVFGFAVTGIRSLFTLPERRLTKGEKMLLAKNEYEANLQAIAQFPDPMVRNAAANAAQQKLRQRLEQILKEA